jgi:ribonuclease BN (tRNA processing enzyme)
LIEDSGSVTQTITNTKEKSKNSLELVFLGTGNAFAMANRYWGTILVNNSILLDCSPITVPHMKLLNRNLTNLEFIFITHFHGDHYLGLPFLLLDYGYLDMPKRPLHIIGPEGIRSRIEQITELSFSNLVDKLVGRVDLIFHEISKAEDLVVNDLSFRAVPMAHGNNPAFGYKLAVEGHSIAYTGDTDMGPGVLDLAKDVELLIIELSNPYQDVPGHMSLKKLKELKEKIDPSVKLALNHVGPLDGPITDIESIILPEDLEILML